MPDKSWEPTDDEVNVARISVDFLMEECQLDTEDPKIKNLIDRLVSVRSHDIAQARFYSSAFNKLVMERT